MQPALARSDSPPVTLSIPRAVPIQKYRPPKKNIPQTPWERTQVLEAIRTYVAKEKPVPPLPLAELKVHADLLIEQFKFQPIYRDYIGVLLNNEMWRET